MKKTEARYEQQNAEPDERSGLQLLKKLTEDGSATHSRFQDKRRPTGIGQAGGRGLVYGAQLLGSGSTQWEQQGQWRG